jgi:hypothetical protein
MTTWNLPWKFSAKESFLSITKASLQSLANRMKKANKDHRWVSGSSLRRRWSMRWECTKCKRYSRTWSDPCESRSWELRIVKLFSYVRSSKRGKLKLSTYLLQENWKAIDRRRNSTSQRTTHSKSLRLKPRSINSSVRGNSQIKEIIGYKSFDHFFVNVIDLLLIIPDVNFKNMQKYAIC